MNVRGDRSPIKRYLLGYAGHDGTTPITLKNVATRVVCQNTLGSAFNERDGAEWTISHFSNAKARMEEAARAFRRLTESYEKFGELANVLAGRRFSEGQLMDVLDTVMPLPHDEHNHPRIARARNKVVELFHAGTGERQGSCRVKLVSGSAASPALPGWGSGRG